jgi:alginate O-acetyltransferase complex protein AlgI
VVFASVSFLFYFLPLAIALYVLLPGRNAVALFVSLLFYSWGEGIYLFLLLGVIAVNHVTGRMIAGHAARRQFLIAGVALNLAVLVYFKYFGFLVQDILHLQTFTDTPHLPLGISFFIFQSISYLVDVYRGDARPARNLLDLALYIAMFPQLIAGPIVRYATVSEALRRRHIEATAILHGSGLFVFGLAQKVLIANNVAEVADAAFNTAPASLGTAQAWLGAVAYSLQIFFDFAGYSLMAIGLGLFMGFRFPDNFNYPYISRSVTEFWRRWHMSLSSWFRDYLYIPLGGNRRGPLRTYFNLLAVFTLCGIWHGAAWTFLVWGLYHGLLLVIERLGLGRVLQALPVALAHLYTLLAVLVGWVLFRADTLEQALAYLQVMFSGGNSAAPGPAQLLSNENLFFALVGIALSTPIALHATHWWRRQRQRGNTLWPDAGAVVLQLLLFAICSVYVLSGTYNPFIYFRF